MQMLRMAQDEDSRQPLMAIEETTLLTAFAILRPDRLLIGDLIIQRRRVEMLRPQLFVRAWHPEEMDYRLTAWPDPPFPLDGVVELPGEEHGPTGRCFVGLDPCRAPEHRRILADFAQRIRRWRSEVRDRARGFEERQLDRDHLPRWPSRGIL